MSQPVIAEETRLALAQSLAVVERNREAIISGMQDRLVAMETNDEAFGQGDVTALVLVRLLIDGAGDLAAFGGVRDLGSAAKEHRRLEIDGRHYSRFGAALGRIMGEALGPRLSPAMIQAWVEAFWIIVRELAGKDAIARQVARPAALTARLQIPKIFRTASPSPESPRPHGPVRAPSRGISS